MDRPQYFSPIIRSNKSSTQHLISSGPFSLFVWNISPLDLGLSALEENQLGRIRCCVWTRCRNLRRIGLQGTETEFSLQKNPLNGKPMETSKNVMKTKHLKIIPSISQCIRKEKCCRFPSRRTHRCHRKSKNTQVPPEVQEHTGPTGSPRTHRSHRKSKNTQVPPEVQEHTGPTGSLSNLSIQASKLKINLSGSKMYSSWTSGR